MVLLKCFRCMTSYKAKLTIKLTNLISTGCILVMRVLDYMKVTTKRQQRLDRVESKSNVRRGLTEVSFVSVFWCQLFFQFVVFQFVH